MAAHHNPPQAKAGTGSAATPSVRNESTGFSDPVEAIKFYMAKQGLSRRDLIPMIGSRSKVSEVLSGNRPLTMPMARALHQHLGIPAEDLLKEPASPAGASPGEIDWQRFPLTRMAKMGWIDSRSDLKANAESIVRDLMNRAGCSDATAALYRKTDRNRATAKTDPYALQAWCWQVLASARQQGLSIPYRPIDCPDELMRRVARFSLAADGPRQAVACLAELGIAVVTLPHLPRTHLDGAAMKSSEGSPVIGLTLRYDRLDNFWFVLLHELAHATRHLTEDSDQDFIDDLRLSPTSEPEREADRWAQEALIPPDAWAASEVSERPSPMNTLGLAHRIGVHPAIVAGRVRYETGNYRLLSQLVGTGEVSRLFRTELGTM